MVSTPSTDVPVRARPSTLLLVAIVSISPLTMNIYLPSLPGMVADFQASEAQVQLTLSVYLFAVAVIQLIIGPLSDRYGRKPVLVVGLASFLAATLVCRFAPTIDILIIGRAFQAIGGCAGLVLGRAMVREVSSRDGAASLLGYVLMGMAISQIIGPTIGGVLDGVYGWQASFDLLFFIGVVLLGLRLFVLRETHHERTTSLAVSALARSHAALLSEGRFWAYSMTGALASSVFFAFVGGAPIISQRDFGLTPVTFGLYFAFIAAGYAAGNFLSGRYSTHIGTATMILYGNVLALAAVVLIAVLLGLGFWHPLSLFGPMFIVSLANGLTMPNSISGALSVRPDLAGTASGVSGSALVGMGALSTVVVGWTLHQGVWPLIIIMVGLAALALAAGLAANALEERASVAAKPTPTHLR
ncbi:MAG: multidrug effflux MFS transporter [Cohaesibacteraceae bacterium]